MTMKIPYGISDFSKIRLNGYCYLDRSDRIPIIESLGEQLLFIRPRRFGKSLLISMLENYYDLNRTDQFDALFGKLKIGQDPTVGRNSYFILKWDFSVIKAQGETTEIQAARHRHINLSIENCAEQYQLDVTIAPDDAIYSFGSLLKSVRTTPHRLYLLIDEYDNFANELMVGREPSRYQALLYGEGLLKTVFKAVKSAASGQGLGCAVYNHAIDMGYATKAR